jgi:peptide/nickel transport system permease protein
MIPIFIGELFCGVSLALIATAFRNRWPDKLILLASIAGMSVSYVVLLILGQWFLGYYFNWFPVWGYGSLKYLALPVLVGVVSGLGGGVRFYRTIFIDELGREYLRTAEAKGCGPTRIYFHHLLRNAAVPLITRVSAILPFLFTGSLLLESFFGVPGLGYAGINALRNSDLQMIKALVILTAVIFVAMNLLADLASCDFIRRGRDVLFIGLPGVEKTHLAQAIGLKAIQKRLFRLLPFNFRPGQRLHER